MNKPVLILPNNLKVYVCVPWDIRNGSITDNLDWVKSVEIMRKIRAGKGNSYLRDNVDRYSATLARTRYAPVISIDYGSALFTITIVNNCYDDTLYSNMTSLYGSAIERLKEVLESKRGECSSSREYYSEPDSPYRIQYIYTDEGLIPSKIQLAYRILQKIMVSHDDANQFLDDNDNAELVEWDWDYDNLGKALSGEQFRSESESVEATAFTTSIKAEYESIKELASDSISNFSTHDSKESITKSLAIADSLYKLSLTTSDSTTLASIHHRLNKIKANMNKISALNKVLALDMQFSEASKSMNDSISVLNNLLDERVKQR